MNEQEAINFLFTIAKEIKRSLEAPVILVTLKDFAQCIFNSLLDIRTALLYSKTPESVAHIIDTFHKEWLQAIEEIENYEKRLKDIPREVIYSAIDFTIECLKDRYKRFQTYITHLQSTMTKEEQDLMQADIAIIGDMNHIVTGVLLEKRKDFRLQADPTEYYTKIVYEIEELKNWLDRLNDHLTFQFCKVVDIKEPMLYIDLHNALEEVINEVANSSDVDLGIAVLIDELKQKTKSLSHIARVSEAHGAKELEFKKVIEKIKVLEDRITRLTNEHSSAVMGLQHKKLYLTERLQSLENLKLSLNKLKSQHGDILNKKHRVFNHLLPPSARLRLVEELLRLWKQATCASSLRRKSIITILSITNERDVYYDETGEFEIDKYGRKVYSLDNDQYLYQLNEQNQLVPIRDTKEHVYFYDECGRYYVNESRQRIYKAHEEASEYILSGPGVLVKWKEDKNNIEYYFDSIGRYYHDESGKRIYCEDDGEYEEDGFGNLVRLREYEPFFEPCPSEPVTVEECKYLQQTVGTALKKCLAEVVLHQPLDPIYFLAASLEKYRRNIQFLLEFRNETSMMHDYKEENDIIAEETNESNVGETEDISIIYE